MAPKRAVVVRCRFGISQASLATGILRHGLSALTDGVFG